MTRYALEIEGTRCPKTFDSMTEAHLFAIAYETTGRSVEVVPVAEDAKEATNGHDR